MTHPKNPPLLPHQKLIAFAAATELLAAVRAASVRNKKAHDQAIAAAYSACRNIAEGASRTSPADKARVFGIARGEVAEAAAQIDVASLIGDASPEAAAQCNALAGRAYALLTGLLYRK